MLGYKYKSQYITYKIYIYISKLNKAFINAPTQIYKKLHQQNISNPQYITKKIPKHETKTTNQTIQK